MEFMLADCLSLPGNPEKPNDDAFSQIPGAAVVLDGATGLGEQLMPGLSDAAWLSQFAARRLMAHMRDGDAPHDALRHTLGDAEKSYTGLRRRAPKERYEIPHASMMFVAANDDGFEALWFGDCAGLLKCPNQSVVVIGDAFAKREQEAARVAKLAEKSGLSPAAGINRPEYLAALRKVRNYTNSEKGHWAFAPEMAAADHVSRQDYAAPAGSLLLLASDGFLALASDYERYDGESLIRAAEERGLEMLGEELREIETGDPEGKRFARFKTHDDATAILLRVV